MKIFVICLVIYCIFSNIIYDYYLIYLTWCKDANNLALIYSWSYHQHRFSIFLKLLLFSYWWIVWLNSLFLQIVNGNSIDDWAPRSFTYIKIINNRFFPLFSFTYTIKKYLKKGYNHHYFSYLYAKIVSSNPILPINDYQALLKLTS